MCFAWSKSSSYFCDSAVRNVFICITMYFKGRYFLCGSEQYVLTVFTQWLPVNMGSGIKYEEKFNIYDIIKPQAPRGYGLQ